MDTYTVAGSVARFPGPKGWFYLTLPEELEAVFRPVVRARWPALVGVRCTVGGTSWDGAIMPIQAGPLFIALPAPVRRKEHLDVGSAVTLAFALRA
jgi:hypothetical protein